VHERSASRATDCHPDDLGAVPTKRPNLTFQNHIHISSQYVLCACFYVRCSEKEMSRFCRLQKQQTPVSQIRNSLEPRRKRKEPFSLNESTDRKSRTRLVQPRDRNMKRTTNKRGKQVENYGKR